MNEEAFSRILNICLDRLAAGESVAACLANYPQHAADLAPVLIAAGAVSSLRGYRISDAGRQRGRAKILRAEVAANESHASHFSRWPAFGFAVPRLAVGLILALLCLSLTTAAVTASKPGDLAYGVRVAVERAPAVLARGAEARARAELGIAERRLADLDRLRSSQQQEVDERTVTALLYSTEQASILSVDLPHAQRAEIAGRLDGQAERLMALEAIAPPAGIATLEAAARQVQRAAERARPQPPAAGRPPTTGSGTIPVPEPTATPSSTSPGRSHVATERPTRRADGTAAVLPTHTPARLRSRVEASATARRAGASSTPQGPGASATPRRAGPGATPRAPGASATPQGPGANGTPERSGPNPTSPGSGPNPTSPGPMQSATPQGPGPNPASPAGGPSATPQGPGPNPTAAGPGSGGAPQGPGPISTPRGSG